jgi:hypothetical protein
MKADDAQALSDMLTDCYAIYLRDFSPQLLVVWFEALREYELADISHALTLHVRNPDAGQYPPKPADITKHLQGGGGTRALSAWSVVDKAARIVGHYASLCFDDPIIHRIVDEMGGWQKLALTATVEDLKFRGIEFQKRYQGALLAGGVGTDYPPYLIGAAEAHNAEQNKAIAPPRLIGDPAKCLAVMNGATGFSGLRITDGAHVTPALAAQPILKLVGTSK